MCFTNARRMNVFNTLSSKPHTRPQGVLYTIIYAFLPLSIACNLLVLSTDQIPIDVSWRSVLLQKVHASRQLRLYTTLQRLFVKPISDVSTIYCGLVLLHRFMRWMYNNINTLLQTLHMQQFVHRIKYSRIIYTLVTNMQKCIRVLLYSLPSASTKFLTTSQLANLFILSITASICSQICIRFLWRIRDNVDKYFQLDESAYIRDIQEYKVPPRFVFTPILGTFNIITAPVLIGVENLLPYVKWRDGLAPGPDGISSNFGLTLLDSNYNLLRTDTRAQDATVLNPPTHIHTKLGYILPPTKFPDPFSTHMQKQRSLMFIGNHTCTGVDMAPMQWNLTQHLDIFLRGIAHWGHFNLPWWASIMRWVGAVPGTRKICSELLTKGWSILIYPGGGREVMKKCGDPSYELMWGDRYGFTKLAIQYQAIIIPIACVGIEEMTQPLIDIPISSIYGQYKPLKRTISVEEKKLYQYLSNPTKQKPTCLHDIDSILDSSYIPLHKLRSLQLNVPQIYMYNHSTFI
uniref:Phospholipid/glycerol acyltransferase domain-containing protein n=2 Tax=Lygus hesperus TaxID=30085 RepID=A0A0A9ZAJ4_LYGHE